MFHSLRSGSECPAPISLSPFLYLLFSHHLCSPFVFYTIGPRRAVSTPYRNQIGESSFLCGLCMLVNAVHVCDCVCGLFFLTGDRKKKTCLCELANKNESPPMWLWLSKHFPLSWGRWKYLVLNFGAFLNTVPHSVGAQLLSHGIKRDLCVNKTAKVKRHAKKKKKARLYSKEVQYSEKRSVGAEHLSAAQIRIFIALVSIPSKRRSSQDEWLTSAKCDFFFAGAFLHYTCNWPLQWTAGLIQRPNSPQCAARSSHHIPGLHAHTSNSCFVSNCVMCSRGNGKNPWVVTSSLCLYVSQCSDVYRRIYVASLSCTSQPKHLIHSIQPWG